MASANINNSKLALAMLNRGWDVEVISQRDEGFTYDVAWVEPWTSLEPHTHVIPYEPCDPLTRAVKRAWQSLRMRHPIAGVRWAYGALGKALELHREKPFDVALSRFLPEYAHLPAMAFAGATGVPWLANWNDPAIGCWPPPYRLERHGLQRIVWTRYHRRAAAGAALNTFPSARLGARMARYLRIAEADRVKVVPHIWLDGFSPPEYERRPAFRLCHAGNMSAERDPRVFLQALKAFVGQDNVRDPVLLEVIGVENVGLQRLVDELGLAEHVRFTGGMGYLAALERLAASDVLVIIEAPCEEGVFLPGKMADYLPVRRPVLAASPEVGVLNDLMAGGRGGVVADCRSVTELVAALNELYLKWGQGTLDSWVSPELIDELSPKRALDLYAELFVRLAR